MESKKNHGNISQLDNRRVTWVADLTTGKSEAVVLFSGSATRWDLIGHNIKTGFSSKEECDGYISGHKNLIGSASSI